MEGPPRFFTPTSDLEADVIGSIKMIGYTKNPANKYPNLIIFSYTLYEADTDVDVVIFNDSLRCIRVACGRSTFVYEAHHPIWRVYLSALRNLLSKTPRIL